jgi:hypothetical protein
MSRALLVLAFPSDREKAKRWIDKAPVNTRIEFKGPRRSLDQNSRMWAMLTDISVQKHHCNLKLSPEDWKFLFLSSLKRELRMVPNLDGNGFVQLSGRSSSDLDKEEMSNLIELMFAWGARECVVWSEPAKEAA